MSTQPPLHEAKAMLKAFMDSKTSTAIDLKKVSQLVDVAISENERKESALIRINSLCADYFNSEVGFINVGKLAEISIKALNK